MSAETAKKQRIRNPVIRAISFVPKGANQKSDILIAKTGEKPAGALTKFRATLARLFKAEPAQAATVDAPPTTGEVLAEQRFWDNWWRLRDAFECACRGIMESDASNKMELLGRSASEFVAALEPLMSGATPIALELVDATLASLGQTDGIEKSAVTFDDIRKTLDLLEEEAHAPSRPTAEGEPTMLTREAVLKKMDAGEKLTAEESAFIKAELAKTANVIVTQPAEVSTLEKQLANEKAEREKLAKQLADAEESRKADAAKALEKELRSEVGGYTVFGLSADEQVALLKAQTPENAALLRKSFAASTAAVKEGAVAKELGSSEPGPGSAAAKIDARATELMKADPKLTIHQARTKVYETEEGKLLVLQQQAEQNASAN